MRARSTRLADSVRDRASRSNSDRSSSEIATSITRRGAAMINASFNESLNEAISVRLSYWNPSHMSVSTESVYRYTASRDRLISRGFTEFVSPGVDDRIAIEVVDCGQDSIPELLFGGDADVTQYRARHLREEALDEIKPGAVLRGKDEGEAPFGLAGEPSCGFLGSVGRVIVEDELDRGCRRIGGVELSQEGDELARTVSFLDAGVDRAAQKVEAGQQAQRSVPDMVNGILQYRTTRRDGSESAETQPSRPAMHQ